MNVTGRHYAKQNVQIIIFVIYLFKHLQISLYLGFSHKKHTPIVLVQPFSHQYY